MSQSATIAIAVNISQSNTGDLNHALNSIALNQITSLLNGTGSDQSNQAFSDERSLAQSASEELDLAGGLVDGFGAAITFTSVKAMIVASGPNNNDDLQIGGAATNALLGWCGDAADVVNVKPGGTFLLTAPDSGFTVAEGTSDMLKITNTDAVSAADYKIILIGTV